MPLSSDAKEWALQILPKLPPELCDSVVDHLHDDKPTLKVCTLVCKAWLPSSTIHLFSSFSWPPCHHVWETRVLTSADDFDCRCGTEKSNFEHLLMLLTVTPRVTSAVSCLRLSSLRLSQPPFFHLSLSTLYAIIDCLPYLRVIEFADCSLQQDVVLRPDDSRMRDDLEVRFRPLFRNSQLWMHDAFNIIPALSPLGKLYIGATMFNRLDAGRTPVPPVGSQRARVTALETRWEIAHCVKHLFHCLQLYVDFSSIRTLRLRGPICDRTGNFLSFFPSTIEELTYHVSDVSPSIPHCSQLRSVTVIGSIIAGPNGPSEWSDIVRDLHAVPTCNIHGLCVTLQVFEDPGWTDNAAPVDLPFYHLHRTLTNQDWMHFARCLERFLSLQSIQLKMELQPVHHRPGKLSEDIPRCIRILREVTSGYLSNALAAITSVQCRCR